MELIVSKEGKVGGRNGMGEERMKIDLKRMGRNIEVSIEKKEFRRRDDELKERISRMENGEEKKKSIKKIVKMRVVEEGLMEWGKIRVLRIEGEDFRKGGKKDDDDEKDKSEEKGKGWIEIEGMEGVEKVEDSKKNKEKKRGDDKVEIG